MEEVANPYAAPQTPVDRPREPLEQVKADRGTRLGAHLIDAILYTLCFGPGYLQLALMSGEAPIDYGVVGTGISILAVLAGLGLFAYNLWLLHNQGQTVAKRWLGIRIVRSDGSRAGLARLFWLRGFLPAFIGAIPCIGSIFSLVDALMIFGEEKLCLHDRMADTMVVYA